MSHKIYRHPDKSSTPLWRMLAAGSLPLFALMILLVNANQPAVSLPSSSHSQPSAPQVQSMPLSAAMAITRNQATRSAASTAVATPTLSAPIPRRPDGGTGLFAAPVVVPDLDQVSIFRSTRGIAVGDFNNDGLLDLVFVEDSTNEVCLNNGSLKVQNDGVPQPNRVCLNSGQSLILSNGNTTTTHVYVGDLNRDGSLDIVTASSQDNVKIYWNRGDGSFFSPQELPDSSDLWADVALADFNGDGYLDIAVSAYYTNTRIFFADGSGSFSPVPLTGTLRTLSITAGDLNGDGQPDLVLGNNGASKQVFINDNGTFSDPLDIPNTNTSTVAMALGDLDGDGALDIIMANDYANSQVALNDGTGHFSPAVDLPSGVFSDTIGVALGDVNGDGALDAVISYFGSEPTQVFLNENDGTAAFKTPLELASSGKGAQQPLFVDWNRDGLLDLVVANWDLPSQIYINVGTAGFDTPVPLPDSGRPSRDVTLGDLDGDGALDVVLGNTADNIINAVPSQLYHNLGNGTFAPPIDLPDSGMVVASAVGDVNGDGALDIVTCGEAGTPTKLYLNPNNHTLKFGPPAIVTDNPYTCFAVKLGDVNGDGWLDLINSTWAGTSIFLNDTHGNFQFSQQLTNPCCTTLEAVLGDLNGDGALDIVLGNQVSNSKVYLNDGTGHFGEPSIIANSQGTSRIAVADFNGDGALDLAMANFGGTSRVYLNDGAGNFGSNVLPGSGNFTNGVAAADINGDGWLDLAYTSQQNEGLIYLNQNGTGFGQPIVLTGTIGQAGINVAAGDLNGDGRPDLVIANEGQPSTVYLNQFVQGARLPTNPLAVSITRPDPTGNAGFYSTPIVTDAQFIPITYTLFNRDNTPASVRGFYSLDGGGVWIAATPTYDTQLYNLATSDSGRSYTFTWDTFASNFFGQSDNVVFRIEAQSALIPAAYGVAGPYQQAIAAAATFPFRVRGTQVRVMSGTLPAENALVYRLPAEIPLGYRLSTGDNAIAQPIGGQAAPFRTDRQGYLRGYGEVSLGDQLMALLPITAGELPIVTSNYSSVDVTKTIPVANQDELLVITSTLTVPQGGTIRDVNVVDLAGTHTWINDLNFVLQSPSGTRVQIMTNSCSNEHDFNLNLDDQAAPGPWPCPPTDGGTYRPSEPLSAFNGEDSTGTWLLIVTDIFPSADGGSLDSWGLQIKTQQAKQQTLYYTSAAPTLTGLDMYTVAQAGVQTLSVSADHPLILFDLDVSLEWDARQDINTLNRLHFDLQRASELLYDWTDGQAALGHVNIYQAGEHWNSANVRLFANNRLRPNASQGGIVTSTLSEVINTSITSTQVITYEPGQVRMAVNWNRYGDPSGTIGDDWARAFAHELGHYLFFQDDDYLGYDAKGNVVAVASCPSAMSDPYSGDKAGGYDEFHPRTNWSTQCANTLANRETGRSDWQTIKRFYPALNETLANTSNTWGPSSLLLAVTQIAVNPVASTRLPMPLLSPIYSLVRAEGGSYAPQRASAYLFQDTTQDGLDDRLIELGSPVNGKVEARGARAGDRLCVFDPEAKRLGCDVLNDVKRTLALTSRPDWSPTVLVTPVTSRTIQIAVSGVTQTVSMQAQLFPRDDNASEVIPLTPAGAGLYMGTFDLPNEALEASVHVWINEGGARRETLTSYSIGGNPVPRRPGISDRDLPPHRFRRAPVLSSDGQTQILGIKGTFPLGEFYALQTVDNFPAPPIWTTTVGQAYRLMKSVGAPSIAGSSFVVNYLDSEVPFGEESSLTIYFLASCGSSGAGQPPTGAYHIFVPLIAKSGTQTCNPTWRALPTTRDAAGDLVSAQTAGEGLYLVLSSIDIPLQQGWNNFSYPIAVSRPVTIALASIAGKYTSVCSYQSAAANPWHCFGSGIPPFAGNWVNDLTTLKSGSYWIYATQAVTLSLKGPYGGALVNQPDQSGAEPPPAIFYGEVKSSPAFTAQPGMMVTAKMGDAICGQAKVIEVDGLTRYVIDVRAVAQDSHGGCGQVGQAITFTVDGRVVLPAATWDNSQMHELDVSPAP